MLCVDHITTGYGNKQVLTDVSFSVGEGEIVQLSGGNGSGKSTVLKTIYGLLHPWNSEGKITFKNQDITHVPSYQMPEMGIAYMPQKFNVFEGLTVEDNLKVALDHYPQPEQKARMDRIYDHTPFLKSIQKRTPFHLSGGERQLLAFALTIAHSPSLVLLDEPFAGMDQNNAALLLDYITRINNNQQVAIIIVDHRKDLFSSIVHKEYQLELGRIKK